MIALMVAFQIEIIWRRAHPLGARTAKPPNTPMPETPHRPRVDQYGLVIVDECHPAGVPAAEAAIRKANVPLWVGLSANRYRTDQMDPLITSQCGPIRHEIEDTS